MHVANFNSTTKCNCIFTVRVAYRMRTLIRKGTFGGSLPSLSLSLSLSDVCIYKQRHWQPPCYYVSPRAYLILARVGIVVGVGG